MKKHVLFIVLITLLQSCKSGLYTVPNTYLTEKHCQGKVMIAPKVLSYNVTDFDIYVYNICERTDQEVDNNRFCDCPDKFFDKIKNPKLKKVEEIYLLKHKTTDLVLYFTTFSHKYIKEKEGFLNDEKYYKNKIVLDQIEFLYIGRFDENKNLIHFPNAKNNEDIILHFHPNDLPKNLTLLKANISTSENRYEIYEPIDLKNVFSENISYKLSPNFTIDFYKNNNRIGEIKVKKIETINIISRKGYTEVIFSPKDTNEKLYKMASKRIKYMPTFSLIEN